MSSYTIFMCTLLTFLLSFHGIDAVKVVKHNVYNLDPNHPGAQKWTKSVGIEYTKELMGKIKNYIWSTIFQQNTDADRRIFDSVDLFLKVLPLGICQTSIYNVSVDLKFLDEYKGDLKWIFTMIMYHEKTHVFQWFGGNNKAPVGLTEGIAQYTVLKANYNPPDFKKPGSGDKWDEGYDVTARFLEYCDSLVPNFVAKMNKKLRPTYDVSFFKELTGKPVEQLWKDYKAKYAGKN